ncbi:GntR family transcriptional regulator [Crenobacter sp. SG2303]|uniref:GntR family transcriptional regulator n=1 Tax=Crenobacter oryzisoli TaxID=3056844 RepID=A0ABT7XLR1_9NEIS|nr:GntR family transcriptional regulator [Crenobacter sp. SG2303]MDN0074717.1 GntR family transcriptional regulator [Crenobacter sp. SG2303]
MDNRLITLKPDESLATPLYLQLARSLSLAISAGWWRPNEALPSERNLSDEIGVSRVTARKALDLLFEQGLIRRRQGSGTFISQRMEQPLSRLTGFTETLTEKGYTPSTMWLSREAGVANHEEAVRLGIEPLAPVARLKRQRLADGVVMAIEHSTLPLDCLPEPAEVGDSLYAHLDALGHAVVRARQHIRAVNAPEHIARLAQVPVGDAMMLVTRVGYTADDRAVELTVTYCRNDYYDFVVELTR